MQMRKRFWLAGQGLDTIVVQGTYTKALKSEYHGIFPISYSELISLPGIGESTAGAILSLACNQSRPILDGNVKRVLSRYHRVTRHIAILRF